MASTARRDLERLVFVGFNRRVAALERDDGRLVWDWKSPLGTGYVALLADGDLLLVSIDGYTYALDPATGRELWRNELKGLGTGIACLATMRGSSAGGVAAVEEQAARARSS